MSIKDYAAIIHRNNAQDEISTDIIYLHRIRHYNFGSFGKINKQSKNTALFVAVHDASSQAMADDLKQENDRIENNPDNCLPSNYYRQTFFKGAYYNHKVFATLGISAMTHKEAEDRKALKQEITRTNKLFENTALLENSRMTDDVRESLRFAAQHVVPEPAKATKTITGSQFISALNMQ
jgi:hypothetical protein